MLMHSTQEGSSNAISLTLDEAEDSEVMRHHLIVHSYLSVVPEQHSFGEL